MFDFLKLLVVVCVHRETVQEGDERKRRGKLILARLRLIDARNLDAFEFW